jgi:hypothetical protein
MHAAQQTFDYFVGAEPTLPANQKLGGIVSRQK